MRIRLLLLSIVIIASTKGAEADPLFFSNVAALQNNGTTSVNLFSNPGSTLFGPQLTFLVDISGTLPPGVTDTLLVTYTEAGAPPISQSFQIPVFGTLPPPFTLVFSFTALEPTCQGTPAVLTVSLLNSSPDFIIPSGPNVGQRVDSFSYFFNVAQPVPEPSTLTLLGAGLIGLVARHRRRRQKK